MRALLVAALLAGAPAHAAEPPGITLVGPDGHTYPETLADIQVLPATDVPLAFLTGHGEETATYRGAPLWALLVRAGLVDPEAHRAHAPLTLRIVGKDGYAAALALGEIDPAFEGKSVLLAWHATGVTLHPDELRLVVPGDKRGGRSVHDVVRVELRQ